MKFIKINQIVIPAYAPNLKQQGGVGNICHHVRIALQPCDIAGFCQRRIVAVVAPNGIFANKNAAAALADALIIVITVRLVIHKAF